ncbi:MAG: TIM barrel protein [bacterium]
MVKIYSKNLKNRLGQGKAKIRCGIKYGIKLWSKNLDCFAKALELQKLKEVDFIELYLVPDSFKLAELKPLRGVVSAVHTPHLSHDFNIFDLDSSKKELFKNEVAAAADFLKARFIIVHAGIGSLKEVFKKNIAQLYDQRILIENMPKIGLNDKICFGYSLEQLKFIKNCGLNICLDFQHAFKSAVSQGLNYKNFIKSLIDELHPSYFHISGGESSNEKDEHLDLFEGDFDSAWLKKILSKAGEEKEIYVVFEVPKREGLENDIKNIKYFKEQI